MTPIAASARARSITMSLGEPGGRPARRAASTARGPSVLIVTAQPLLTHALSSCFTLECHGGTAANPASAMILAGAARSLNEAVDMMRCRNAKIRVVVLDLDLVRDTATEAIGEFLAETPDLRILTLSSNDDLALAVTALRAGACGYLSKEAECEDFTQAIHKCLDSDLVVDAGTLRLLAERALGRAEVQSSGATAITYGLDRHEVAALGHLAQGRNNQEIAAALFVSLGSVKAYLTGASKKLGVRDRVQLLVRAYELGLVVPHLAQPA